MVNRRTAAPPKSGPAPTPEALRDLLAHLLAGVVGGTEAGWHKLVGEVEALPIVFHPLSVFTVGVSDWSKPVSADAGTASDRLGRSQNDRGGRQMTLRTATTHAMVIGAAMAALAGARGAAAEKPALIHVHCDYADFEFEQGGNTADVIDRTFKDDVAKTIADVKASPRSVLIAWDRTFSTPLGLKTLQSRYLIDRATGGATITTRDTIPGTDPIVIEDTKHRCTITP